jgi:hypothetical protein
MNIEIRSCLYDILKAIEAAGQKNKSGKKSTRSA